MKNGTTTLTVILLLAAMAGGIYMYQRSSGASAVPQQGVSPSVEPTQAATLPESSTEPLASSEFEVPLDMDEKNGIDQSGKATFTEENGKVTVKVEVNHPEMVIDPQPLHIHKGTCPGVGAIVYPLNSLENGVSETVIDVKMADLKKQLPLAINIHKSLKEPTVYTACGQLP